MAYDSGGSSLHRAERKRLGRKNDGRGANHVSPFLPFKQVLCIGSIRFTYFIAYYLPLIQDSVAYSLIFYWSIIESGIVSHFPYKF
jgi:hypothetical protein